MTAPTAWDIKKILEETPHTTFLTCSRKAETKLNFWAVESLFTGKDPLCELDMDTGHEETTIPARVKVYKGMRITLTKNLNKPAGFVNGMGAEVLGMTDVGMLVRTDQRQVLMVHPWTNENWVTVYPFRLGYASTLHKVQGATLDHITLWLDFKNLPASAYVALSRVRKDKDWRFIGDPGKHHFTPARFD